MDVAGSRETEVWRIRLLLMTDQQYSDTQTLEPEIDASAAVHAEALAVIDEALGRMMQRDLVSSSEVADLLLDLRTLLITA